MELVAMISHIEQSHASMADFAEPVVRNITIGSWVPSTSHSILMHCTIDLCSTLSSLSSSLEGRQGGSWRFWFAVPVTFIAIITSITIDYDPAVAIETERHNAIVVLLVGPCVLGPCVDTSVVDDMVALREGAVGLTRADPSVTIDASRIRHIFG